MWWRRRRYTLLLVALCAIATCPRAHRSCNARIRAREATELLDYLSDRVIAYAVTNGRMPPTPAGPTPSASCCDQDGECAPDAAQWATPGWQALAFSIDTEHRYSYAYIPAPDGKSAVIRAIGNVNCDEIVSTYELTLTLTPAGVRRVAKSTNPRE
jgi:hypothetical protein